MVEVVRLTMKWVPKFQYGGSEIFTLFKFNLSLSRTFEVVFLYITVTLGP